MGTAILAVVIIVGMIAGCYLLSGTSNVAGTIFEKKTIVKKK
jgi:hypothetical protein